MINISPNVSPIKSTPCTRRSVSAVEMLKLGREVKSTPTTEILVCHFDFKNLAWGLVPVNVEF